MKGMHGTLPVHGGYRHVCAWGSHAHWAMVVRARGQVLRDPPPPRRQCSILPFPTMRSGPIETGGSASVWELWPMGVLGVDVRSPFAALVPHVGPIHREPHEEAPMCESSQRDVIVLGPSDDDAPPNPRPLHRIANKLLPGGGGGTRPRPRGAQRHGHPEGTPPSGPSQPLPTRAYIPQE